MHLWMDTFFCTYHAQKWIVSVNLVTQRDGRSRFDVETHPAYTPSAYAVLRSRQKPDGVRVRIHRPFAQRQLGVCANRSASASSPDAQRQGKAAATSPSPDAWSRYTFLTLNVQGLFSSKPELVEFIRRRTPLVLALQETRVKSHGWGIRIPSFRVFHQADQPGEHGRRGVAIAVHKSVPAIPTGLSNPYLELVRAQLGKTSVLFGSAYVPPQGPDASLSHRREALASIRKSLVTATTRFPDLALWVGGDWNMSSTQLRNKLATWLPGFDLAAISGSNKTHRSSTGRWTAIDSVILSPAASLLSRPGRVLRSWDGSDHWPIEVPLRLHVSALERVTRPGLHLDRTRLNDAEVAARVCSSNYYAVLAQEFEPLTSTPLTHPAAKACFPAAEVPSMVEAFSEATVNTVDSLALHREQPRQLRRKTHYLTRAARLAIRERRLCSARLRRWETSNNAERTGVLPEEISDPSDVDDEDSSSDSTSLASEDSVSTVDSDQLPGPKDAPRDLRVALRRATSRARRKVRAARQRSWSRFVAKGTAYLAKHDLRPFWRWTKRCVNGDRATPRTVPVRNAQGHLVLNPEDLVDTWTAHYRGLLQDSTGNSQADWRDWHKRMPKGAKYSPLPDLNLPLSWGELLSAVRSAKQNKAAGASGIPAEWYRTLLLTELTEEDKPTPAPTTAFGKCLLALTRAIFETGEIPTTLNTALMVSIPKKGDPAVMDNYRGISLIESILKLISTIVAKRLTKALTETGRLARWQAGFRPTEECVAQAATLLEVCQRRQLSGQATYLAFVDFRKAFDLVPHGALLAKLRAIGVRGATFKFIAGLYKTSSVAVTLACGTGQPVPCQRGVRQGCPLSPILFDVFINDILVEARPHAAHVPQLGTRLPGLGFADDLVLVAASLAKLKALVGSVEGWAIRWEMEFGVTKCGLMGIGHHQDDLRNLSPAISIAGEPVPIVDDYMYLGIKFHHSLDVSHMIEDRVSKAWRAFHVMHPLLTAKSVPVAVRRALYTGGLLPVILYGAELTGMSSQRIAPLQKVHSAALRVLAGAGYRSRATASSALQQELGIHSVHAMAAARRIRLHLKMAHSATFIRGVLAFPFKHRKSTWVTQTRRWFKRFGPTILEIDPSGNTEPKEATVPQIVTAQQNKIDAKIWDRETGVTSAGRPVRLTARKYMQSRFNKTNAYLQDALAEPGLSRGVLSLLQARTGSFWTAQRAANAGLISDEFTTTCPCCYGTPETLKHFLLHCPSWQEARETLWENLEGHLPVQLIENTVHSVDAEDELVTLLLGGSSTEFSTIKSWATLKPEDESVSSESSINQVTCPIYRLVADYFQATYAQRSARVWASAKNRRPDG